MRTIFVEKTMKHFILLVILTITFAQAQQAPRGQFHLSTSRIELQSLQELPSQPLQVEGKKSVMLGMLLSAVLPGMGELYADRFDSGKYFTITEGALWGVYAGMTYYGNWQEDSYKSFAESHGGVTPGPGQDEDFFADVGNYISVHQFNDEMAFERQFDKMYDPSVQYWNWESTAERKQYRNQWTSSENAYNNVRFVVGAMILNRLVSIINTVRLINSHNDALEQGAQWGVYFDYKTPAFNQNGFTVNMYTEF